MGDFNWCINCIHDRAVMIAGEDREHLTPCWDCGGDCGYLHRNFVNKYCSTCKYRNMTGEEDPPPPCGECGDDYHCWEQGEENED